MSSRWTNTRGAEKVPLTERFGSRMKLPRSLIEGHRRFLRDKHAPERGRYIQLAELGQAPTAMVIACCDARVDVSAIFDTEPGELFILRNVANLVPPHEREGKYHGTSAAFEFAAIRSSLANLRTFPFIQKRTKDGLLSLHGLHFDIASGAVLALDEGRGSFADLDAA